MSNLKVKEKMNKILAKPRKKMKKLLTNKHKGYRQLAVNQQAKDPFSKQYYAEDLSMDIDASYGLNTSYHIADEPHSYDTSHAHPTAALTTQEAQSLPSLPPQHSTSITQTYVDDVLDKGLSKKTEFCVVPIYLMILMMSMLTTALLAIHEISETLGMMILSTFTLIGAIIGMYGIYAWGKFNDVLVYLRRQNTQYLMNIDRLNSMGEVLQNDIADINHSVDYLKRDGNILEETMHSYDELRNELKCICDKMGQHNDSNQDVMDLLTEFNEQCAVLNTIVEDNEKAHLLSIFYSVKLYDFGVQNSLDRKQYHRFLAHCGKETRARFEKEGGFDAMDYDKRGYIDVHEFETMVHKVLAVTMNESQHLQRSSIRIKGNL